MLKQRYFWLSIFTGIAIAQRGGGLGYGGLSGLTFPNGTASEYGQCGPACASVVNGTKVCGGVSSKQNTLDCFCSNSFMENGTACYACLVLQNETSTFGLQSEIADTYSACVDDTNAEPCPVSCGGVYSALNCLNTTAASPKGSPNGGSTCYCTDTFSAGVVNCTACLAPYSVAIAEEILKLATSCPNAQNISGLGNLTAGGALGGGAGGVGQGGAVSLASPSSGSYTGFFTAASGSASPKGAALADATFTTSSAAMSSMTSRASPTSAMATSAAASTGAQSASSHASALEIELTVFAAAIGMALMLW